MYWHPHYPSHSGGSLLPRQAWNMGTITEAGNFLPRVLPPWSLFTTLYNCHSVVHESLLLLEPVDLLCWKTFTNKYRKDLLSCVVSLLLVLFSMSSPQAIKKIANRQLQTYLLPVFNPSGDFPKEGAHWLTGIICYPLNQSLWFKGFGILTGQAWLIPYPWSQRWGQHHASFLVDNGEGVVPQKEEMGCVNSRRKAGQTVTHMFTYSVAELKDWSIYKILTSKMVKEESVSSRCSG